MAGTPLQVIVGLGNPGPGHLLDRHNAGFWFVDLLAERAGVKFRAHSKYQGEICRVELAGREVTLLKPHTYMNRSGLSIRALMDYMKVPPAEILVTHDEMDLNPGVARFKFGGGHGGHNGLKDTILHAGPEFWRLRVGVGHPGDKALVIDFVLKRAPRAEEDRIVAAIADAADYLPIFITEGSEKAMNRLHTKNASGES
jgi:PTH1 family peptidyl-tRNA hydrolase